MCIQVSSKFMKTCGIAYLISNKTNILPFLQRFVEEMKICLSSNSNYPIFDQPSFNCVAYTNCEKLEIDIIPDDDFAIHLSGYKFSNLNIIDNCICNKHNKPYSIIHQYDCHPNIKI